MNTCFRWYGYDDPVKLDYIRQIPGMKKIVTAIYTVPVGEVWPMEDILELKKYINDRNLDMDVIESIPVHEDIKLGRGDYLRYIENYKENIRRCAKAGVKVICYNFMPVLDWTRSQLDKVRHDGSTCLVYYQDQVDKLDIRKLSLPGWDSSYTEEEINELLDAYQKLGTEGLWENAKRFVQEVMPVAKECDINMAIHPDDPPWPIFGLPRIISTIDDLERYLSFYDDPHHGLTLCAGSLGCDPKNDYIKILQKFTPQGKVHFAHLRNIKFTGEHSFEESGHLTSEGSLDFAAIVKAYHDLDYKGYVRPDHGRFIWGETGKPGYGLYDRALGVTYINGLFEMCDKIYGKNLLNDDKY